MEYSRYENTQKEKKKTENTLHVKTKHLKKRRFSVFLSFLRNKTVKHMHNTLFGEKKKSF